MGKKYTPREKVYATIKWQAKGEDSGGSRRVTIDKKHTEYADDFMSKKEVYKKAEKLKKEYAYVRVDWEDEEGVSLGREYREWI